MDSEALNTALYKKMYAEVETRVVDGKKYIMIPADEGVEVNGLAVKVKTE